MCRPAAAGGDEGLILARQAKIGERVWLTPAFLPFRDFELRSRAAYSAARFCTSAAAALS